MELSKFFKVYTVLCLIKLALLFPLLRYDVYDDGHVWFITLQVIVTEVLLLVRERHSNTNRKDIYNKIPALVNSLRAVSIFLLGIVTNEYSDAPFWYMLVLLMGLEVLTSIAAGVT